MENKKRSVILSKMEHLISREMEHPASGVPPLPTFHVPHVQRRVKPQLPPLSKSPHCHALLTGFQGGHAGDTPRQIPVETGLAKGFFFGGGGQWGSKKGAMAKKVAGVNEGPHRE